MRSSAESAIETMEPERAKRPMPVDAVAAQYSNILRLSDKDFQEGTRSRDLARGDVAMGDNQIVLAPAVEDGDSSAGTMAKEAIAKKPLYYRAIKRAFDIVFSSLVIAIGFIPGLILSIIIAIDTKASPIYSSIRVGSKGPFKFYKFRTMVADSDNLEKYFTPEQLDQWHREHKVDNDPRVTKIGRIMRATSIDELPQFVNVWLSQISTIGPRCVTEEELGYLGKDKGLYLSVPSGITGAWQIGDRNSANWENGTRQAIELDYVRKASLKTDIRIFLVPSAQCL